MVRGRRGRLKGRVRDRRRNSGNGRRHDRQQGLWRQPEGRRAGGAQGATDAVGEGHTVAAGGILDGRADVGRADADRLDRQLRTGRAIRAVAQDETGAQLVGIDLDFIHTLTFALATATAAMAGAALLYMFQAYPTVGLKPLYLSWYVVMLVGLGNVYGAVIGGFIVALPSKYDPPYYFHWLRDSALVMSSIDIYLPDGEQ